MIPDDVVSEIIKYVPDIDIRRNFNIYDKININEYNILNTITRKTFLDNIGFKRYYCNNNVDFNILNSEQELNDFVDVIYKDNNNTVKIELHIWKLIKKNYYGEKHKNDGIYYLNNHDNEYYWKDISFHYLIT